MRTKHFIAIGVILVVGLFVVKKLSNKQDKNPRITHTVEKGALSIQIYATGNLEAEQSTSIDAPSNIFDRDLQIWDITITDMVEEGTVVDSGQYVASLDQNMIQEMLVNAEEELELAYNSLEDASLDSNLTLNNNRDAIITAEEDVEEKILILAESKYESPATIQKSKMDKDKALRKLAQAKQSFELQTRKEIAEVKQKEITYKRKAKRYENLKSVLNDVIIKAPQKGMVIYSSHRGNQITVGSKISAYNPTILTLPDLSTMISVAYVNEIDVSQVKPDQDVALSVDAFPNKTLSGKVVSVANIGQTVSGSDAKVFEVIVKVLSRDPMLRPAMTTNNTILTSTFENVVKVPTETIFSNDSLHYIFNVNKKPYKQIVRLGEQNESYTIIEEGVNEGDQILWVEPENSKTLEFEGWDIYEKIKEDAIKAEIEAKKEADKMSEEKSKNIDRSKKQKGGKTSIRIMR